VASLCLPLTLLTECLGQPGSVTAMAKRVLRVLELAAQIKGKDGGACRHEMLPQGRPSLAGSRRSMGRGIKVTGG
jgi:hypothetical protein